MEFVGDSLPAAGLSGRGDYGLTADEKHVGAVRPGGASDDYAFTAAETPVPAHEAAVPRVLEIDGEISRLSRLLTPLVGGRVELALQVAPGTGRVMAGPGQVTQVVAGLAAKVCETVPHGGVLSVRAANVTIAKATLAQSQALAPGDYVAVMVGSAMEAGTSGDAAASFSFVPQGGGRLRCDRHPGGGMTFTLYLPRVQDAARPADSAAGEAAEIRLPRGTEKVLLVEDETPLRRLILRVLRGQGYEVTEMTNGLEALARIQEPGAAYHLLVTDVRMPGLGGKAMAEQARGYQPGLRVLFISGYPDLDVVRELEQIPGTRFLAKPFSLGELARQVRAALDG